MTNAVHGGGGKYFPRARKTISPKASAFKPEGKSWWLPHHVEVNPNKPNKVTVVFGAAA